MQRLEPKKNEGNNNQALGRSRGGFGTKIHMIVDSSGTPLNFEITGGEAHDSPHLISVLNGISIESSNPGRPRTRPRSLSADKAYSSRKNRFALYQRGIKANIPRKSNEEDGRSRFDSGLYRDRNIVERVFGWLKEKRRIGTRFDKLKSSFEAMICLALCEISFRRIDSSDRA